MVEAWNELMVVLIPEEIPTGQIHEYWRRADLIPEEIPLADQMRIWEHERTNLEHERPSWSSNVVDGGSDA
jgi:hypothetical protein